MTDHLPSSGSPEASIILERLERLEKQNVTLKRLGVVVLGLMAGFVLIAQTPSQRTVEAERFILRDQSGKMRGQITMQPSGEPALEFFGKEGERQSSLSGGRLLLSGRKSGESAEVLSDGLIIESHEGHIDLGGPAGLRLKITSTTDPAFGFAALGITPSVEHQGVVAPGFMLQGKKGQGFAYLNVADGPRLHMEPGMWQGKQLPGGFVDINAGQPLIAISDQQGFAAALGGVELKDKQLGKLVKTPTASIVLTGKDRVLWRAP
jgi:hypothetical protein